MTQISAESIKRAAVHAGAYLVGIATDGFEDYPEHRHPEHLLSDVLGKSRLVLTQRFGPL